MQERTTQPYEQLLAYLGSLPAEDRAQISAKMLAAFAPHIALSPETTKKESDLSLLDFLAEARHFLDEDPEFDSRQAIRPPSPLQSSPRFSGIR